MAVLLGQSRCRSPQPPAFTKNSSYSTRGREVEPAGGNHADTEWACSYWWRLGAWLVLRVGLLTVQPSL